MAWYEPSRILAIFNPIVIPRVVDGTANPILVAIAQRGYRVQSRLLRIPDRLGYFSSGPPLLQAHQSHELAAVLVDAVVSVATASILVWLGFGGGDTRRWLSMSLAANSLFFTIAVYVGEVFYNPMRAPDYDWAALSQKSALAAGSGMGTLVQGEAPRTATETCRAELERTAGKR